MLRRLDNFNNIEERRCASMTFSSLRSAICWFFIYPDNMSGTSCTEKCMYQAKNKFLIESKHNPNEPKLDDALNAVMDLGRMMMRLKKWQRNALRAYALEDYESALKLVRGHNDRAIKSRSQKKERLKRVLNLVERWLIYSDYLPASN
jgi:hypothetical protein